LLVPAHFLAAASLEWRKYRARLYPPGHREARLRDEVKDLLDQIHIRDAVVSHMTFLETMSTAPVWNTGTPSSVLKESEDQGIKPPTTSPQVVSPAAAKTVWPTLPKKTSKSKSQVLPATKLGTTTWNMSGQTSLASDDSRSMDSTQNLTQSSIGSQNRFRQLEEMIRVQQEQSQTESREAQARLCNMEIQFNRIEDLDTKVAAVQEDMAVVHNQLSMAAQTQHQLSLDVQSLQNQTSSQFAVLGNNGVAAMESQHLLSQSMLDLRSQFSQMLRLMQDLSNKLENTMTNRVPNSSQQPPSQSDGHHSYNAQEERSVRESARGKKRKVAAIRISQSHHVDQRSLKHNHRIRLKRRNMTLLRLLLPAQQWTTDPLPMSHIVLLQQKRSLVRHRSRKKRRRNKRTIHMLEKSQGSARRGVTRQLTPIW
jgi:hypothetical protein